VRRRLVAKKLEKFLSLAIVWNEFLFHRVGMQYAARKRSSASCVASPK